MRGVILSKYKARRTEYDGIVYDSMLEAQVAERLDTLMSDRQSIHIVFWQRQIPYELIPRHGKDRAVVYKADFWVLVIDGDNDDDEGKVLIIEVKGYETAVWNLKRKLFLHLYPEADLRVVRSLAEVDKVILEDWKPDG